MMGKKEHSESLHSTVEGTVEYKGRAWWGRTLTQQVDTNLGKRGRRMLKILRCSLGGGSTSDVGVVIQYSNRQASLSVL